MIAVLIDVENGSASKVNIDPGLETYYRLLDCELIDMAVRNIGDRSFTFIVDDEGLFRSEPQISAVDNELKTMFVGNLLIVGPEPDSYGNEVGLSDDDADFILSKVAKSIKDDGKEVRIIPVLTNVEYRR